MRKPIDISLGQAVPAHLKAPLPKGWTTGAAGAVAAFAVLWVVVHSVLVVVPAGARGVMFNRVHGGVQRRVLGEGMAVINPLTTEVIFMTVQAQTYTMSNAETEGQVQGRDGIEAKTKDGQIVNCDISVRYFVDPQKVADLYQAVGLEYEGKVVLPTIRSSVRDAIAQYPVDVVYSEKREDLARQLTEDISQKLQPRGLVVEEFLLRDISFTPEYAQAIEGKQIEQQNALRKQYDLQIAAKEADRQRISAEGEAAANDIRGTALKANPKIIQYDYVRKIAPNVKAVVVDSSELRQGAFGAGN